MLRCNDSSVKPAQNKLDQPDLTADEVKRLILLDTNYVYSMTSATNDALQIAAELDQEDFRKGKNVNRSISRVISYSIPDTIRFPKSVNRKSDPGFYVFNFSGDNGFAIISGDERVLGRLGYSGKGTLDNSPHTGLRIFMSRVVDYIQFRRQTVESMRGDSIYVSLIKKLNSFRFQGSSEKDAQEQQTAPCNQARTSNVVPCNPVCNLTPVTSLSSTSTGTNTVVQAIITTQWDQIAPFNNNFAVGCNLQPNSNCYLYANSNYYAGCVPVSEAQVIANYYARRNLGSWRAITNTDICSMTADQVNTVAWLIKDIYNQYTIKFKSCSQGTFTFDQDFIGLTNDYGISPNYYLVQGEWRGYNNGDLEASLRNGSPVLILGSQHEWCAFFNFGCGPDLTCMHQWIMDGLQTVNQISTYIVKSR